VSGWIQIGGRGRAGGWGGGFLWEGGVGRMSASPARMRVKRERAEAGRYAEGVGDRASEDEMALDSDAENDVGRSNVESRLSGKRARVGGENRPRVGGVGAAGGVSSVPSRGSEPGTVAKIHCENFMCHGNLDVLLERNVNYIVGQNGSGKSAVLAALIVAMGVRARATDRAKSMKELIRSGCRSSKVAVSLRNEGPDAYRPEEYGELITVERTITQSSSGMRLLNGRTGAVVSTARGELERILDQFNIEVGNPCAVMQQETAKKFLHSGSGADKYKFFMKATLLENIELDLEYVREQADKIKDMVLNKKEELPVLKQAYKVALKELEDARSIKELHEVVRKVKAKLAWSMVEEKEVEAEKAQRGYESHEAALQEGRAKLAAKDAELQGIDAELQGIMESIDKSEEVLSAYTAELEARKASEQEAEVSRRDAEKRAKQAERELTGAVDELNFAQRALEDTKASLAGGGEGREAQEYEARIQLLTTELEDTQRAVLDHGLQLESYSSSLAAARDEMAAAKAEAEAREKDVRALRRDIQGLEKAQGGKNSVGIFNDALPRILQDIQRARGLFSEPPIGPIGAYCKLKDDAYANGVEAAIGKYFASFIASSFQDATELRKLIRRAVGNGRQNITVYVAKFGTAAYQMDPRRLPAAGLSTVLRVISVSDPVVHNLLVDQGKAERIVLVGSDQEGRSLIYDGQRSANVAEIVSNEGTRIFRRGSSTSSVPFPGRLVPRLGVDVAGQLGQLRSDLPGVLGQAQAASARVKDAGVNVKGLESQIERLRGAKIHAENSLSALQGQLQEARLANPSLLAQEAERQMTEKLEALEANVRARAQSVDEIKEAVGVAEAEAARWAEEKSARRAERKQKEHELNELGLSGEGQRERLIPLSEAQKACAAAVRACGKDVREHEEAAADCREAFAAAQEEAASNRAKVRMAVCTEADLAALLDTEGVTEESLLERVRVGTARGKLEKQYKELTNRIQRAEEEQGKTVEELEDAERKTRRAYNRLKTQLANVRAPLNMIQESLRTRSELHQSNLTTASRSTKHYFNYYMTRSGKSGKINFNHEDKTLSLVVNMNVEKDKAGVGKAERVTDTKSLSGGERSFSTTAFVLALGREMESPFRAMDEFDVFMDGINRKITMDMLHEFAMENPTRQFIFITPQDISAIKVDDKVHIQRMKPPRR